MLQHHIGLGPEHLRGNDGLGRFVFLPGSRSRAATMGQSFDDLRVIDNPRGHTAHLGSLCRGGQRLDVIAISSGMGTPSTEIIAHELLTVGARRIVRVGSCGSLHPEIRAGDCVILSGAVRDEMSSRHWVPVEFPALSHPDAVTAMSAGARAAGHAAHTFIGIGHSKASFYAREMGVGPMAAENLSYMQLLARSGVLATEMEASLLFVLASAASAGRPVRLSENQTQIPVQTACVLGVYAYYLSEEPLNPEACQRADQRAIETAIAGIFAWAG